MIQVSPTLRVLLRVLAVVVSLCATGDAAAEERILGQPGRVETYQRETTDALPGSVIKAFTLAFGPVESTPSGAHQWLRLEATKANGARLRVWLLTREFPPRSLAKARKSTARYIVQVGDSEPLEFRDRFSGAAILPVLGAWEHLFPHAMPGSTANGEFASGVRYLGLAYQLQGVEKTDIAGKPPETRKIDLLADAWIGVPHNTKQKNETRRWDDSDYELIRLTRDDYREMIDAGLNCLRVDAEQASWVDRLDVYHWGTGGTDVSYPECLYLSNYLGPSLFLDEPAVGTRDHVLRPRLARDAEYRKTITPQIALEEFKKYFDQKKRGGASTALRKGLAARADVDLGDMKLVPQHLYTWETMVSTALYQLAEGKAGPPSAMVFEPPDRVGTLRSLPEMNMTYGCQIPVDSPKNLTGIIYGFLRGAARATDKSWGMSIYGAVNREDTFWFQTHAYDLGARLFFYWDTHRLACVPYGEVLALSRNLMAHIKSRPLRDMERLEHSAEVAILLPPGYNLGHVYLGKGPLWGLRELNLERLNRRGVKYRVVMRNFFVEIERCIRLGVAYDLLWDLQDVNLSGYREVVHVREDGRVAVVEGGKRVLRDGPRTPVRPSGVPPRITVELSTTEGTAPLNITATAHVVEGSAAIYYTIGADARGVHQNAVVLWELYGPEKEDYRFLLWEGKRKPRRISRSGRTRLVEIDFRVDRPGHYRLRAATVDLAGRSSVAWKTLTIGE